MRAVLLLGLLAACAGEDPCAPDDAAPLGTLTAWEQDLAETEPLPESPDPGTLTAEDGLALSYRDWVPAAWDGTGPLTVLVPGSTAHAEVYARLAQGLQDRGVYTRVIDVRGHGRSVCASATDCSDPGFTPRDIVDDAAYFPGRLGDSADDNQLARDLGLHLADLAAAWPDASHFLAGHSSGGGLVSRYAENAGVADLDGVILLAPYNHPDQPQVRPEVLLDCPDMAGTNYARVDLGAVGAALRGAVHRYTVRFHKGEDYTLPIDTLAYTWTTMNGMATRDPDAFWQAHTAPLLFLAAEQDHLLDPDISRAQAERAAGAVTFVEVADTSHVGLSWSDEVAGEMAGWMGGLD